MTRKEQVKILDDKIEADNAQYNLDRMNAEISAYSSGDLPIYEYLTKKDLNYKPNAFEQAKFEYSPLGKVFIDGLDKSDTKFMELIISLIDNDEFRIPGEYYAKPLNNTNLSWMKDEEGYKETAEEVGSDYMKGKNDNELKLIKDFITKINNGTINKNKVGSEFRKLKQKVTNDILRQDLIKYLEKYLFGEDIEPEEKYEKSIAERVKTRRDTQRTFAPSSPPKEDYSAETDEYLKYLEEQEKDRKKFSDEYDSSGSYLNKKGKGSVASRAKGEGLKILTIKQMLNRLPILLAQIQAGNNSNKLKNELRQVIYSLYRSKVLTKTVYNNLIEVIRA